jgi:hypothetical protein
VASIDKRKGNWRVQVRRGRRALNKTFRMKADAEAWARDVERAIDMDIDPTTRRITTKDSFASLINQHIDDLATYGKPLRRSKESVLRRLEIELGSEPVANLTRDRLIQYGRERVKAGAGPATLAIDLSFIGTVLTHAAAMHGFQANTEAVRLARVALRRMGAVGRGQERDGCSRVARHGPNLWWSPSPRNLPELTRLFWLVGVLSANSCANRLVVKAVFGRLLRRQRPVIECVDGFKLLAAS